MKQAYQLTDGYEVFETAELTLEEAAEKNQIASRVTGGNITWQPVIAKETLFNSLAIGDRFTVNGTPYQKTELQHLPRYGYVNAVAMDDTGKTYEGDTGHRHFYADVVVVVN